MKWEIDNVTKHLDLEDHYFISFDRLTEKDWCSHLAEKEWVNMKDLFSAFVAAYDAAGLPLTESFFKNYQKSLLARAETDYHSVVSNLWNLKFRDNAMFRSISDFKSPYEYAEDLISGVETKVA